MLNCLKNKVIGEPKRKFAFFCVLSLLVSLCISLCFISGNTGAAAIAVCIIMTLALSLIFSFVAYVAIFADGTKNSIPDRIRRFFDNMSSEKKCMFLLQAAVLFTCLFVFLRLGFSGKIFAYHDIGADTTDQYIPWYVHVINSIRDGSFSLWENELGFGNSISIRLSNMNDPFILFSILLGVIFGSKHIVLYLVISRVIIFAVTAAVSFRFVSLFCKNPIASAIASYIFAYNSFGVIWGQHYMFASYSLYAVTLLYFIEIALRREENRCELGLVIISFLSMINGAYLVYMIYLPAVVYTLLRYAYLNEKFSIVHFLKKGVTVVLNIALGLVGGLVTGISTISAMLSSGRVAQDGGGISAVLSKFLDWYDWDELIFRLQRMISGSINGVGSSFEGTGFGFDYYNAAQIFFSVFFIIFALQFLFTLHKTSENKKSFILNIISVIFIVCALSNQGFSYVMYAFSGMSSRPIFTILPYFAILVALVIDNIFEKKILNKFALLLGVVLTQILLFKSYFGLNESTLTPAISHIIIIDSLLVFGLGYIFLMFDSNHDNRALRNASILALCLGLVINVTAEMDIATNRNGNFEETVYEEKNAVAENVKAALEYIESIDPDYYRTEEAFFTYKPVADSLMIGFNSVTMYDSALSAQIREFNSYYLDQGNSSYPSWIFPVYTDSMHDLTAYSTLSLKYILSIEDNSPYTVPQDNDNYEYLTTIEGIRIYRNKNVNSFTTFYTQAIKRSEFLSLSKADRLRLLSTSVIINDEDAQNFSEYLVSAEEALLSYKESDITASALLSESQTYVSDGSGYIIINLKDGWSEKCENTFIEFSSLSHGGASYDVFFDTGNGYDWRNQFIIRSGAGNVTEQRIYIPKGTKSILFNFNGSSGEILDLAIYNSEQEIRPSQNPATIELHEKDSHLAGRISCDKDGVLFIPVVYNEQWHVEIDGKEAEIFSADSGFMAVNITEGEHEISIKYVSSSLRIGLILCLCATAITVLWCFEPKIRAKIKKKREAKTND